MTSIITNVAQQYRARSEEARKRADLADDRYVRTSLLRVAETWERMAKWEERSNMQRPQPPPSGPPKPYC